MENITTLTADLRKLQDDPSFSDMVFVCGDGEEVRALRLFIAARSDVLHSLLLTSGMAETQLHRVPLPSMHGPIMRICLEFLYTDQVEYSNMCAMCLDEVMEVLAASRFLILPGLEKFVIDYCLKNKEAFLRGCYAEDLFKAFNLVTDLYQVQPNIGMRHLLLAFIKRIEAALNQEPENYTLLSECSCLWLLANLEPSNTLYPLQEYRRFIHAIKWCAYTSVFMSDPSLIRKDGLQKLFDEFVPSSEGALLAMLVKEGHKQVLQGDDNLKTFKVLAEPMSKLLDKSSSLDLSKIPLTILSKIFEPLGIFPSSKLLKTYKFLAHREPNLRWDAWCLHENYSVSPSDSTEIQCTKGNLVSGFARSSMCIRACEYLFFEWEIVLLDACRNFRIGFCMASPAQARSSTSSLLGFEADTAALASDGSIYHRNKEMHFMTANLASEYGSIYHRNKEMHIMMTSPIFRHGKFKKEKDKDFKGTTFGVHIQPHSGVCIFKMNGDVIGQVSIPAVRDGVYPAVSMQTFGRACIRVVSHCPLFKET